MQNAAADGVEPGLNYPNDAYRAVISDLVSLIEHVQKSLRLINQAIARETSPGSKESSTNVIVLDDVSPRYMRARAVNHLLRSSPGVLHATDTDRYSAATMEMLDARPCMFEPDNRRCSGTTATSQCTRSRPACRLLAWEMLFARKAA